MGLGVLTHPEPELYCHWPPGMLVVPVMSAVPLQITAVVGVAPITGAG